MRLTVQHQRRICRALAQAGGLEQLVGEAGPTKAFFAEVASPGPTTSTAAWLLLKLAHCIWHGVSCVGPQLGLMLLVLEPEQLDLVGRLLCALAAADDRLLEAWLANAVEVSSVQGVARGA